MKTCVNFFMKILIFATLFFKRRSEGEKVCRNEKTHDNKHVQRSTDSRYECTRSEIIGLLYMHFSEVGCNIMDCTTGHEKV